MDKAELQYKSKKIDVDRTDFHPVLKDIENLYWIFILSHGALSNINIQNILKTSEISLQAMLKKYNNSVNLKTKFNENGTHTSSFNILGYMIPFGKMMSILTYDYLLSSKYQNAINKLDEFKFLKFIRNGASHDNIFNMKDEDGVWKLEENEVIKWEEKEITRNLHEMRVFNDFINATDIFLLTTYFSDKLKEIDTSKK